MTCQKCHKQNPPDAAFCGFCGAKLAMPAPAVQGGGAKTVFGYTADPTALARAPEPAAAPAPAAAPTPARAPAAPPRAAAPPAEATIPLTDADLQGQPLVGARYVQGALIRRLPTGELYRARDVKQEGDAELLIVDAVVFPSPLDMERARRELRQLQKVECRALVRVLDHGKTDDGRLYIALEPVLGSSVDELVARGAFDLSQAQKVIREVGTALAEAQKMGVIHRDIAPHNVLVAEDGEVRVRGFAVAAPIKKHVFGTAEYISPEQASGRPVDQRSNIYSLGALMYFLLTGEPPFVAGSAEELLQKHQNEEPPSPRQRRPDLQLPPRAEALILKALAKSSSRRHLTLRQFLREVESLTDAAPTHDPEAVTPLSFVTPLHGVTALTGGRRPPSTELPPGGMLAGADAAATITDSATVAPTEPSYQSPEISKAQRELSALQTAIEAPAMAAPPPAAAAFVPEEPVPLTQPKQPKQRQQSITGEMSSDIALKQAPPAAARAPEAPKPAPAPAPAAAGKPGFRETMWFFKGEVESAMAETGGDAALPSAASAEATPQELTAKYADDGSLSDEEAKRLSLRTGKTQMMMNVKVPKGPLPGDKMAAEDFIHEMNRGRKIAMWGGGLLLLALIAALVAWLVVK